MIGIFQMNIAQDYLHEFGKYSNEDFQLKKYDKDPSAEAVVIYDIGESYFTRNDDGFKLIFERKMKIKILSKAGLKWAEISIPYYVDNNKNEEIEELKGNTYNFDNGEVRTSTLNSKNTYSEKYNEHWVDKKFAMPDVKEGSIIEIYYKIVSPYFFNFRNWEFQNEIPVIYSKYTTSMIPFYLYTYVLQGANKFDDFKSYEKVSKSSPLGSIEYKDMVYEFIMKDIPAFNDEAFITSPSDYIIKLDFQLAKINYPNGATQEVMTTWPEMCKEMMDNSSFGKYLNSCKRKATELIDTMNISSKSSIEKAKKIERFVKTNFNWNGKSDKYATKNAKEFLSEKTGNSADINLFLVGMLNSAGIEAYPVIISTRPHGKIKLDYPFSHFFNYVMVLAKLDSGSILLDATEPLSNFNEIPAQCLNDKGLVIQKNKVEWVNLKSNSFSRITYYLKLQLTQGKDSIKQDCELVATGYEAIDYRNKFSTSYNELKAELLGNNALSSNTLLPTDLNQIDNPFKINFKRTTQAEVIENKIIIAPFYNFALSKNPLKQPTRNYPLDFTYKKSNLYQSTITIPVGYKLMTKPDNMIINNQLIKIVFITDTNKSGTINVTGNYEFKKDIYEISDYTEIKNYFKTIVEKFNERIVFIKEI